MVVKKQAIKKRKPKFPWRGVMWAGVAIAVPVGLFGMLLLRLNPERLRTDAAAELTRELGRRVRIEGVRMAGPFGAFQTGAVVVSEDPAFGGTPLLRASSARFEVKLLPL